MIWKVLKKQKGGQSILPFMPFTFHELKAHLEQLFEPWMSWENYGEWHVDHVVAQSKFNYKSLADPEFKQCWALSNLRPLKAVENWRKGTK